VTDAEGAPYLRYFNHKMNREALVPIDEELHREIAEQQSTVNARVGGPVPILFRRPAGSPSVVDSWSRLPVGRRGWCWSGRDGLDEAKFVGHWADLADAGIPSGAVVSNHPCVDRSVQLTGNRRCSKPANAVVDSSVVGAIRHGW
jgi:hypothetical protein